ncbi:MAG: sodium:proton antiporter, partial [Oscillospiraceae bacterium]|nr:sodium:proton antiporter [Oscillospiraceae bacterium]
AISTVLNAVYYIKALATVYSREGVEDTARRKISKSYTIGMSLFIVANVALGLFYQRIVDILSLGMKFF